VSRRQASGLGKPKCETGREPGGTAFFDCDLFFLSSFRFSVPMKQKKKRKKKKMRSFPKRDESLSELERNQD
jgi:hypothetical protein